MTRNLTTSLFVKLLVQTQKSDWRITDSYVCSIAEFHINVLCDNHTQPTGLDYIGFSV